MLATASTEPSCSQEMGILDFSWEQMRIQYLGLLPTRHISRRHIGRRSLEVEEPELH